MNRTGVSVHSAALMVMVGWLPTPAMPPPGSGEGASVLINEIQYAPASGEPEWLEIVNAGGITAILHSWSIADAGGTRRRFDGPPLPPGTYAVLAGDTLAFRRFHPAFTGVLIPVSGFPSLNNTGDILILADENGTVCDSVAYASPWGGGGGVSLERVDTAWNSTAAENWRPCEDPRRSTPGELNSVARQDIDIAVVRCALGEGGPAGPGIVAVNVRNTGRRAVTGLTVSVSLDINGDSLAQMDECVVADSVSVVLLPDDSLFLPLVWDVPIPGEHTLMVRADAPGDRRLTNNRCVGSAVISIPPFALSFNEILYDPFPGWPEFVEITNLSPTAVELRRCMMTDRPTTSGSVTRVVFPARSLRLGPGEFLAVSSDSTLLERYYPGGGDRQTAVRTDNGFSLNNDGDAIVLRSSEGRMVDSVAFDPSWHNPDITDPSGRSLEKLHPRLPSQDPRNWSSCPVPACATPGKENSIALPVVSPGAVLRCQPNPFSPDADGREDYSVLRYELPLAAAIVQIRIFDVLGRHIRLLAREEPSGSHGEVVWDGRRDDGSVVRTGMYVVLLEVLNSTSGTLLQAKGVVAVVR